MTDNEQQEIEDRRKFLISAGRFAAVTPAAITLLLSTSLTPSPNLARTAMADRSAITATATAVATTANGKDDKYR